MYQFSPASFTVLELTYPILLALIFAVLIGTVGGLYKIKNGKFFAGFIEIFFYYLLAGVPIALVGYSAGFLSGISRSPAIGSVIPAILTIIGGLSIYIFGSDDSKKLMVGYCVTLLIFSLFYGAQSGSYERDAFRENRLKYMFELEARLKNYRANRDLPVNISDWILLGESSGK